jgi:glucosamine kinase
MGKQAINEQALYIGIDGGGTKCRARIVTADLQVLGTGVGGPANPYHGVDQAKNSILSAAELALQNAGLAPTVMNQLIAGVGLAGVNVPGLMKVMQAWDHPFAQMFLTTDLHIASLGAHQGAPGAVMIVGTGSCGYTLVNNQALILGAHGFPIGDKGSGAWMGLEAVKAVLLASDNLGPATCLSETIGEYLQARDLALVDKLCGAKARDYAQLAVLVMDAAEAGDSQAEAIVKEGAAYMSAVAARLWATAPGRMSMIGGLAPRLIPWMDKTISAHLSPALYQPEFGAALYAQRAGV